MGKRSWLGLVLWMDAMGRMGQRQSISILQKISLASKRMVAYAIHICISVLHTIFSISMVSILAVLSMVTPLFPII